MTAEHLPRREFNEETSRRHLWLGAASLIASSVAAFGYLFWNADRALPFWGYGPDDLILAAAFAANSMAGLALIMAARREVRSYEDKLKAERWATERDQWLRVAVAQLPTAICVMTAERDIALANSTYRALFGQHDVRGTGVHTSFEAFNAAGQRYSIDTWPCQRALRTGEIVKGEDIIVKPNGGENIWLSVSAMPIYDDQLDVSSVVVVFADITSRRRVDEAKSNALRGIINAQEGERLRIARELHDELGQDLTALSIGLKTLERSLRGATKRATIARFRETVDMMSQHVRSITSELRPLVLADFGLRRALEDLALGWAGRLDIPVEVHVDGLPDHLPETTELVAYRVVQEALTNVAKHAMATSISLTARVNEGCLRIVVEDDGVGFEPGVRVQTASRHFGLVGISERLSVLGGTLDIESSPGGGTTLLASLPVFETELIHGVTTAFGLPN